MTDQKQSSAGSGPPLSKQQVVLALADVGNPGGANMLPIINANVDPMAADAGSAQWLAGADMAPNDALYRLIQEATGWDAAQMEAFIEFAGGKTA